MRASLHAGIALASVAVGLPAIAQTAIVAESAAPADGACQIHVWATNDPKSYLGSFSAAFGGGALGGLLDAQLPNNKAMTALVKEVFTARRQAELLARQDLAKRLGMPGAVIVLHDKATEESGWKNAKAARLTPTTGACYAEVQVRHSYFVKASIFPPEVRSNYTLRDFRSGKLVETLGRGSTRLTIDTAPGQEPRATLVEALEDGFAAAFNEYLTEKGFNGA
ncbi:hypothetical protein [Sandarakinorhabdus rubra]|uniref:hypothetical protein n=1 Tax=Sandarakinorhabdus rubra TaxID=2672568 RepID=UPI0013D90EA5|nr:hypothetical protein [Sandarakinorhabdus rubra]